MNYVNGFAIGDDGRVLIEDSKPVYYFDAMPMTSAGNSSGEQGGTVTFINARAGFDADGKTVYQDVAVTPYTGKIFASMGFLHTDAGALLCDSAGQVFNFNGGVPLTVSGSICIKSSAPPPPKPVIPSAPTLTSAVAKSDTTIDVALTAPTTGTAPFTYYARASAAPAEPVVVKLAGLTGTITGLKPDTEYTVDVYATNVAGQGAFSNAIKSKTKPTAVSKVDALPNPVVTESGALIRFNRPTGTDPITYKALVSEAGGAPVTQQLGVTFDANVGSATIGGLKPNTAYKITVYGTNAAGDGAKDGTPAEFTTRESEIPAAPILNNVYPGKTSLVFAFTYPQNLEPEFYTAYANDGTKTTKAEVFDPDQDTLLDGLTEGKEYTCWVTATSATNIEGAKSNEIRMTCKSVIPAPNLKSITPGNGQAIVTFDPVTPPEPFVIDHYSYVATNAATPDNPEIEAYVGADGKILLPNNVTWLVEICAVCNPGLTPGDFSPRMEVTPEKPRVPYKPSITKAAVDQSGIITVAWTRGLNGQAGRNASGLTVDSWKVTFKCDSGGQSDTSVTITDPNMTQATCPTTAQAGSTWSITVVGINTVGSSDPSEPATLTYNPAKEEPFIGGVPFDDGTYKYIIFNTGTTTGYEALRMKAGESIEAEVLLIGAGGGGKGQTLVGAKGGDGGGGQLVLSKLPASAPGSIFVTVPNGSKTRSGDNPPNTTIKEGATIIEAIAGKSATDKGDAQGYPKQEVPLSWQSLNMFSFLKPSSNFVGGSAQSGEQNYPNATFAGEGGAGTKDSQPGGGGQSYAAIRWKK